MTRLSTRPSSGDAPLLGGPPPRSPTRRVIMAVVVLALAGAVAVAYRYGYLPWGDAKRADAEDKDRKTRADATVTVTTSAVRLGDFPVTIDSVGTVQALNSVVIRTQVDGRLIRLAVDEGQDVKKGDVVAEIDPSLYKAQYDQAVARKAQDEATLANSRIDLLRYQKLVSGNFATRQQYDTQKSLVAQQEALVRADQASIDNAKTTLDYATIHSPIDGRAGIRLVDVGNILHAADVSGIIIINQLKPIYVSFTIPQQSLQSVRAAERAGALRALALAPDNSTTIDSGRLSVIDNAIDPTTGTAKIKATFQNSDLRLWPGEFVNVRLIVDTLKNATLAPSVAVQRGPEGAFVYIADEAANTAVFRAVTIDRQDEANAVVTSGLRADEKVVTSGFARLTDGARIRVVANAPTGQTGTDATGRAPASSQGVSGQAPSSQPASSQPASAQAPSGQSPDTGPEPRGEGDPRRGGRRRGEQQRK